MTSKSLCLALAVTERFSTVPRTYCYNDLRPPLLLPMKFVDRSLDGVGQVIGLTSSASAHEIAQSLIGHDTRYIQYGMFSSTISSSPISAGIASAKNTNGRKDTGTWPSAGDGNNKTMKS